MEGDGENPNALVVQLLFGLVMTGVSVARILIGLLNIGHCSVEFFLHFYMLIHHDCSDAAV